MMSFRVMFKIVSFLYKLLWICFIIATFYTAFTLSNNLVSFILNVEHRIVPGS